MVAAHSTPMAPLSRGQGGIGTGKEGVVKIPQVIFMSEFLTLVGTDGSQLRAIVHYDTMSGCSFAHNVPDDFNHGGKGLVSELFNMSTFLGEGSYSLPVMTLKVERQGGHSDHRGLQPITCYVSDYPSIPPVSLPPELLQLKPGNVSPRDLEDCSVRVMIGCEYSNLFPRPVKTPVPVRQSYSGMTTYRSQFSGRLLLAGRLDRDTQTGIMLHAFPQAQDPNRPTVPFLMTIPQRVPLPCKKPSKRIPPHGPNQKVSATDSQDS